MAPNISRREYVRRFTNPPSEPTQTLVVTSGQNSFIDIRILNDTDKTQAAIDSVLPLARLDWAFAGVSSTELRTAPDGQQIAHATWRHTIDSRTAAAEEVQDDGDMLPQAAGRTLERGESVDPATGKTGFYEECWMEIAAVATDGNAGGKRRCVVLTCSDDEHKVRGMVVRVGQLCQGLMRVGEEIALERWGWEPSTGWTRAGRIGRLWLPCGTCFETGRLQVGAQVRHGDYCWTVDELVEF